MRVAKEDLISCGQIFKYKDILDRVVGSCILQLRVCMCWRSSLPCCVIQTPTLLIMLTYGRTNCRFIFDAISTALRNFCVLDVKHLVKEHHLQNIDLRILTQRINWCYRKQYDEHSALCSTLLIIYVTSMLKSVRSPLYGVYTHYSNCGAVSAVKWF